jgi:diacylglycerol kinase (ATP)
MQALLFHNPTAGTGSHTPEGLLSVLREAGYFADYCSTKGDYKNALEKSTDVIVVAGGDGALARVVRDLGHRTTPIAIWPLGTANNVARSLGIHGDPDEILDSIRKGSLQSVDVGIATGPWGKRRFIEALGVGAFAHSMQGSGSKPPAVDRPRIGRERLQEAVANAKPESWKLKIDGETLEGEFLMIEIANTSFFGPGLRLAPLAEVSDQQLDVVYLRPEKRNEMLDWLAASKGAPPISTRRGRHISFKWEKGPLHVDDRLWGPPKKPMAVKARVDATQLHVYVPESKSNWDTI